MNRYTPREMMAIVAARQIRDGDIVFCGTGISMLAAMAAKHIHAPASLVFFETGALDSRLEEIPLTVADSRVMHGTALNGSLADAFGLMQNRFSRARMVGILGAAQIDRFGNLNTTTIGDYSQPDVRFPGSGGGCDVASFLSRTIIFMEHERRRFVPRLDYLTSPGWLDGPEGRQRAGLPPGGPSAVVTNLALLRFDDRSKEMYLAGTNPGTTAATVIQHTGFPLDTARSESIPPPSLEELDTLRRRCDPQRLILGPPP